MEKTLPNTSGPQLDSSASSGSRSELPVRIYSPEPLLQHPIKMLRMLWRDIGAGRELAWRLTVRDTAAQYRQTMFGYVWAFLPPIVAAATFIFLRSQGLFSAGETAVPYAAFAMIGTMLWQVFVDALQSPLQQLQMAKPMLAKINFPREAILLSGIYKVFFAFLIRLVLLAAVLIIFRVMPNWQILLLPVAFTSLLCTGMSVGLALVPIGGLYGDVGKILPMITAFLMLLTPVVYPPKSEGIVGILSKWNPLSHLMITARQSVTGEAFTNLPQFALIFAASIVLLLISLVAFRIAIPHLIARMGG